jgi:membrane-associated HD superfamily phosphohydrolase
MIWKLFHYSDSLGLVISLIALFFFNRAIEFPGKKPVKYYYIIFFLLTVFATVLSDLDIYNNWVYDTIPLFLSVPLFFFFRAIFKNQSSRNTSVVSMAIFCIVYIVTFKKAINLYLNTEYYLCFAVFILINSASYLLEQLSFMNEGSVIKRVEFWFVVSLMFYAFVGNLIWTTFTYLIENGKLSKSLNMGLWPVLHNSTLFISCSIFTIAYYWRGKLDF